MQTLEEYQQEQRNRILRRQRGPRHYGLKAETVVIDSDPTLWTLVKRGAGWCWSRTKWNAARILRLRKR